MSLLKRTATTLAILVSLSAAHAADVSFDLSAAQPGRLHVGPNAVAIVAPTRTLHQW